MLFVLSCAAVIAGCSSPSATTYSHTDRYAGVEHYWSDMGGSTRVYPISATWTFATDSSRARLITTKSVQSRDTLDFTRSNSKWAYIKNDFDWAPEIHWTADSLIIAIGYGFTVESYNLKKQ
jgi:hypothetical protein